MPYSSSVLFLPVDIRQLWTMVSPEYTPMATFVADVDGKKQHAHPSGSRGPYLAFHKPGYRTVHEPCQDYSHNRLGDPGFTTPTVRATCPGRKPNATMRPSTSTVLVRLPAAAARAGPWPKRSSSCTQRTLQRSPGETR